MTPAEKKASELALEYICNDQVNVDDSFTDHKDSFISGFKAALELAEVKGMEEALKLYAPHGLNAKEALTKWREFVGESNG